MITFKNNRHIPIELNMLIGIICQTQLYLKKRLILISQVFFQNLNFS